MPGGKAGENTWLGSGCQGGCSLAETAPPHFSHLVTEYLSAVWSEPRTHLVQEHLQEQVGGPRAWDSGTYWTVGRRWAGSEGGCSLGAPGVSKDWEAE